MEPTPFRVLPPALEADRYLARARQFRRAAMEHVDIENGEPNWPKWSLIIPRLPWLIGHFRPMTP